MLTNKFFDDIITIMIMIIIIVKEDEMEMNLKHSKQRDALFELLQSVNNHPTAEWLYQELKKDYSNISLATVYRNLAVLCQCGEIIKIEVGDGTVHYDAVNAPHCHFICGKCKSVIDIDVPSAVNLNDEVNSLNDVIVTDSSLVFRGLCSKCK